MTNTIIQSNNGHGLTDLDTVPANSILNVPARFGTFTKTGWIPPAEPMPFEHWQMAVGMTGVVGDSWNWWMGDLLLYGGIKYKETYAQAVETFGWTTQHLRDAVYVSRNVPPEQRNPAVHWSNHKEVAPFVKQPEVQREWLERAEAEGLTVLELQEAIRVSKGEPKPLNACLDCQQTLSDIRNAELCMKRASERGWQRPVDMGDIEAHLSAAVWLSKRFNYMAIKNTGEDY